MKKREIERITISPLQSGFLGEGHEAATVIDGNNFPETDPFILLMDDRLNLPGGPPAGGPHPHAGFETVTLVLQGNGKDWKTGSLELMTAGKGIIHTEEITTETHMRILQLWLVLPPEKRWTEPFLQQIQPEDVPVYKTAQTEVRVYSGSSNGVISPLRNHTPFTLLDSSMEARAEIIQEIPAAYNGFVYVVDGSIWVGNTQLTAGQAGWLNKAETPGESEVVFRTQEQGARFVFYAGKPHHARVVHHGPFIGDTPDDILRLYKEYREGKMPHVNDLPEKRKIRHTIS